jgi:ketosteroid isomerase-like protein
LPTAEDNEQLLRSAYRAFNAREVEAAVALMSEEVDWPNAWEGGRVIGRDAVREYWRRQFEQISSEVEPQGFEHESDAAVTVLVRQVVRDANNGEKLSEGSVRHRYRIEDGLIVRMDVLGGGEGPG